MSWSKLLVNSTRTSEVRTAAFYDLIKQPRSYELIWESRQPISACKRTYIYVPRLNDVFAVVRWLFELHTSFITVCIELIMTWRSGTRAQQRKKTRIASEVLVYVSLVATGSLRAGAGLFNARAWNWGTFVMSSVSNSPARVCTLGFSRQLQMCVHPRVPLIKFSISWALFRACAELGKAYDIDNSRQSTARMVAPREEIIHR